MKEYLDVALRAVRQASEICSAVQAQLVAEDTLTKKDRSPVTVADFASQAVICRALHEAFPQIPIVAEEDANSLREAENRELLKKIQSFLPSWSETDILQSIDFGNGEPGELFWTLDPIDGTKGFLRKDQYAVALALLKDGEPILGVLGCPNLPFAQDGNSGTLMYALQGAGSFAMPLAGGDPLQVHVSQNDAQSTIRFLESVEAAHSNHSLQGQLMAHFGDKAQSVRYDSQVKYAVLAQGLADVYLRLPNPSQPDYREKIWDHAAGYAIVKEAGGQATDMFGKPLEFFHGKKLINNRGVVVTNGKIHETIIALLNGKQND